MNDWLGALQRLLAAGQPAVRVVIASVRGSAPRDPGTAMLVSADAVHGTIGGGHLEFKAIDIARNMLANGAGRLHTERFALGATLGQCCGGAVELWFERFDAEVRTPLWIFGAGHVGRALVQVLAPARAALALDIAWVDNRDDAFDSVVAQAGVAQLQCEAPAEEVRDAPPGALVLVMTHSHDIDYDVVAAWLRRGDFMRLGLIGSATKALRFRQKLAAQGFDAGTIDRIICPIGVAGVASKEPAAIALAVAAQVAQWCEAAAAVAPVATDSAPEPVLYLTRGSHS